MRAALGAVTGIALAGLAVAPFAWWWQQLPDPVSVPWGGATANSMSRVSAALLITAPAVACGLAVAVLSGLALVPARGTSAATRARLAKLAALAAALGTLVAGTGWAVALANHHAVTWQQEHPAGWAGALLPVVAGAAVLAGIASLVRVRPLTLEAAAARHRATARESVALGPGEHALWTGRAYLSWWLTAFLLVAAGVFLVTVRLPVAVIPAAAMLGIYAAFGWIRVSVDWRGLRIGYGLLPWPVTTIPMARLQSAERIDLRPLEWGGWGYRGSRGLGRAAVVVRSGDAIRLQLAGRGEFAVTVDDAASGAGLLNDLIARERSTTPTTPITPTTPATPPRPARS
jgi:hypothetical protein